jgi:hypothetical protein
VIPAGEADEHDRRTAGARRPAWLESADIAFTAEVGAKQLTFHQLPQTWTEFTGVPAYESASGNERANVPEHIEEDVTYRDVRIRYWLAAEVIYAAPTDSDGRR